MNQSSPVGWCLQCGCEPTVTVTVEHGGVLGHYSACSAHVVQVAARVRHDHPGAGFAITADEELQTAVLAELQREFVYDVQEPVRRGVSQVPTVRDVAGRLVVDWPEPRPESFTITSEVFEMFVDRLNGLTDLAVAENVWRASEGRGEDA